MREKDREREKNRERERDRKREREIGTQFIVIHTPHTHMALPPKSGCSISIPL